MAEKSFPFDSVPGPVVDGVPTGDRPASSADWANYIGGMIPDGVLQNTSSELKVSIDGNFSVSVAPGEAIISGRRYSLDAALSMGIDPPAPSQARIDRIILRMSTEPSERKIYLTKLVGAPGGGAPALAIMPTVRELCLAEILVKPGTLQLVPADITDTRGDAALCGWVNINLISHVAKGGIAQHPLAVAGNPGFSSLDFTAAEQAKVTAAHAAAMAIPMVKVMQTTIPSAASVINMNFGGMDMSVYTLLNVVTQLPAGASIQLQFRFNDDTSNTYIETATAGSTNINVLAGCGKFTELINLPNGIVKGKVMGASINQSDVSMAIDIGTYTRNGWKGGTFASLYKIALLDRSGSNFPANTIVTIYGVKL